MMAIILSNAYKGSILSTLIAIRYEEPLDTIEQMVDSGLPYYVFGNSAGVWVTKTDPRNMTKKLNVRRVDIYWEGITEEKYLKMYKKTHNINTKTKYQNIMHISG